jgi:hypothetical protein
MLKKYMTKESTNSFLLAIFLIGLFLMLYSTYQYFDIENQFADIAKQRSEIGEAVQQLQDTGNTSAGVPLASKDIELRRRHNALVGDQDNTIKSAGVGIVMIAASWMAFDLVRSRRRKTAVPTEKLA